MALAKYAEEIQELIWEREAAKERKATCFTTAAPDPKQYDPQLAKPAGENDRYCFIKNHLFREQ